MTYHPAKPRHTLHFAGKDYELLGTFETIEAVEHALQDDVVRIANRLMDLSVTDTAKLTAVLLTTAGYKSTPAEVGRTIAEQIGVTGTDYARLKLSLYAFLRVCVAPPAEREEVARTMGELLGKWSPASPGESTSGSA